MYAYYNKKFNFGWPMSYISKSTTIWLMLLLLLLTIAQESSTEARPANFRDRYNSPSICLQPPPRSESVCAIEIEGFYYDTRTNDCELYIVGGCRTIPGQSFGSRQDCLATCVQGTRRIQDLYANE